jgi:small subunit ribosomal protein S7
LFLQALENIGPTIELKVRRIAGANYQIPTPVEESRRRILALR